MKKSRIFDNNSIADLFGQNSEVYLQVAGQLQAYIDANPGEIDPIFARWEKFFASIHCAGDASKELFIKHSFLALLVKVALHCRYIPSVPLSKENPFNPLKTRLSANGVTLSEHDFYSWTECVPEACQSLFTLLRDAFFAEEDIFQGLYQSMSTPLERHAFGEFYTPPALAREMVGEIYSFGQRVLDPACGSGIFLVELTIAIKDSRHSLPDQVTAIGGLFGLDVQPLAILVTQANLLLLLADYSVEILPMNLFLADALFPPIELPPHFPPASSMDVVIGNPPWLVLNGINSKIYQVRVKALAKELGILRGGKYATHAEISALFFYRCRDLYCRDGGLVFFVATAGLLSGDQHAKFRQFKGFGDPFVWTFDQDVFRIHNICLGMWKMVQPLQTRLQVQVTEYSCHAEGSCLYFTRNPPQVYVPYNLRDIHAEDDMVLRLIPEADLRTMLPRGISPYFRKFYQGASLVPRMLIFVAVQGELGDICDITPDMSVQCKPPWNFQPYPQAHVEREYIYPVAKSADLTLFKLLRVHSAFLPFHLASDVTTWTRDHEFIPIKPLAQAHFEKLKEIYQARQKSGASITNLWTRLNYNGGLANSRQAAPYKVIFRGIGGYTQAAFVRDPVIVDTSCYFYPVESEDEGYYLLAILNSLRLSQDLRKRGSTGASGSLRNLHKKPLEYPIPLFDDSDPVHRALADFGRFMEQRVDTLVQDWRLEEFSRAQAREARQGQVEKCDEKTMENVVLRVHVIQRRILKELIGDFQRLDELVENLFHQSSTQALLI